MLNRIARHRKISPKRRARGSRTNQSTAGTHFIQVASAHSRPLSRGPVNCAAQSISVSNRLMLPVSRFAPTGKASRTTMIAVVRGRRWYAQWTVQSSSRIVAPRHTTHATSHGSSAHGAKSGSIHGA